MIQASIAPFSKAARASGGGRKIDSTLAANDEDQCCPCAGRGTAGARHLGPAGMLQSNVMDDEAFNPDAVEGLALLLWSADRDAPHRLGTPFSHAAAAAAMDLRVEIYFSARSVELLVPGVAAGLRASQRHTKTVLDAMRDAVAHGAVLLVCSEALAAQGIDPQGLIPECGGRGGAVQFIARTADPRWRTLVF